MGSGAGTEKIAVQRTSCHQGNGRDGCPDQPAVCRAQAWVPGPAPARVNAGIRLAAAGPLEVSVVRYRALILRAGQRAGGLPGARRPERGRPFIRDREQLRFVPGMRSSSRAASLSKPTCATSLLARSHPEQFLADFAEERLGLAATSTRIESIAPLSGVRRGWSRAAAFICGQLLDDQDRQSALSLRTR